MAAGFPITSISVPAFQSQNFHEDALKQSEVLAEREVDQMNRIYKEAANRHKAYHKEQLRMQSRLHAKRMMLEYDLARKEAIRDVLNHRSAAIQSTMIVNALLIGCVFAMVYTFVPPQDSPPVVVGTFSTFLVLSLLFLCLSIFLCLQCQTRMSQYDIYGLLRVYSCGQVHKTFSGYFQCHCASLQSLSTTMMYIGATFTISAASILMYLTFALAPHGVTGASIMYAVVAGFGVVALWILEITVPSKTHDRQMTDLTGYSTAFAKRTTQQEQQEKEEKQFHNGEEGNGGDAGEPAAPSFIPQQQQNPSSQGRRSTTALSSTTGGAAPF